MMRWLVLLLGLGLVFTGLYLQRTDVPESELARLTLSDDTLRRTGSGPVRGGLTGAGTQAWLGIPYAAPPVGPQRFRAPKPPRGWSAPRDTVSFGQRCPQFASRLELTSEEPGTLIGSEDCLTLNIFAPAGADERSALPVMVFLHGGGNTIGSTRSYDGSRFVQEQGVVMVTVNYRLGVLGWFSHPALRETAATPAEASGNFALLDMIRALEWVRENVAVFGGDPERVTLFGESAGARDIYALLASPLAKGLFHGAILQSGAPGTYTLQRAENPADAPQPGHAHSSTEMLLAWLQDSGSAAGREEALQVLRQLRPSDIAAYMRELPLPALLAPVATARGMYSYPALFRDGTVLPKKPLLEVFRDPTAWNRVPVLAGTNRDEMKLFLALNDRHVKQRFGLLPQPRDPAQYNQLARLHSLQWKASGVDEPLASMAASDPSLPLFAYRFDWDDMRANWLVDLPQLLGAAHALELDFLFGPLISRVVPGVLHDGNREGAAVLGRAMRDYWAGFAYSGRPGTGRSAAHPVWPTWDPERTFTMVLDEEDDGGIRVESLRASTEATKLALAEADGLSDRMRCALYVDLFLANRGMSEFYDAQEYQRLGCGPLPAWSLVGQSR